MWLRNLIRRQRHDEGQSLLETAVAMPLLLGIAFNLINLGYFWFVVLIWRLRRARACSTPHRVARPSPQHRRQAHRQ